MTLTFKDLREANLARCTSPGGFNHALDKWSVAEWGCAVAGEVGEACNHAKKLLRVRDGIPGNKYHRSFYQEELAQEIADAVIYLDLWAASQGYSLEDIIRKAFNTKSDDLGYEGKI